ncbi:RDD family protein [Streptomyces nigrescens]
MSSPAPSRVADGYLGDAIGLAAAATTFGLAVAALAAAGAVLVAVRGGDARCGRGGRAGPGRVRTPGRSGAVPVASCRRAGRDGHMRGMNATPPHRHIPPSGPGLPAGPAYPATPASQGPAPRILGNRGLRLLALFIDGVLALVVLFLVTVGVGLVVTLGSTDNSPFYLSVLVALALLFLYSPLLTARCGGTLGKLLCGLSVVQLADGSPLSYGTALGRHLAHLGMWLVPVLCLLDPLACCWDRTLRRCLHDKVAGSVVIRRSMRPAPPPAPVTRPAGS